MKTIHLQIQLVPAVDLEKPKTIWYYLGYAVAQAYKISHASRNLKKSKVEVSDLFKDWNKDYSDLEKPAVFRKKYY